MGFVAHYHPDVEPSEWGWHFAYPENANLINAVAGDAHDPDIIFAAGEDDRAGKGAGIWRSTDGGHAWQEVFYAAAPPFNCLLVDPNQPGVVYAAGVIGFYWSRDGGESWSGNSGPPVVMEDIVQDELGQLYSGGWRGIWFLPPGQATWEPLGLNEWVQTLIARPGPAPAVFAGGMNGVWRRDLPPVQRWWLPVIGR